MTVKEFQTFAEKKDDKEQILLGKVSEISHDYFSIVDIEFPENEVTYYFQADELPLGEFALGDIALAKGDSNTTDFDLKLSAIEKIDLDYAQNYIARRKPFLKLSIINYPKVIKNACEEDIPFELNIKNISDIPINYDDLFNEHFGYTITYRINDVDYIYHSIENFGTIRPGEDKDIKFFSNPITNSNMQIGNNSVYFAWAQKSLYDIEFLPLSSSEAVNISVQSNLCE